jgi:hypothetical protein
MPLRLRLSRRCSLQGALMKKQQPTRGFWDWVMGNGWGTGGTKG